MPFVDIFLSKRGTGLSGGMTGQATNQELETPDNFDELFVIIIFMGFKLIKGIKA
jgi:hypothetical protein